MSTTLCQTKQQLVDVSYIKLISANNEPHQSRKENGKCWKIESVLAGGGSNEQEEAGFLKKTEKVFLKDDAQIAL